MEDRDVRLYGYTSSDVIHNLHTWNWWGFQRPRCPAWHTGSYPWEFQPPRRCWKHKRWSVETVGVQYECTNIRCGNRHAVDCSDSKNLLGRFFWTISRTAQLLFYFALITWFYILFVFSSYSWWYHSGSRAYPKSTEQEADHTVTWIKAWTTEPHCTTHCTTIVS